ncbi:MAG: hypothetical protein IPJ81_11125 [Chitinophagaceae bacterium]|nr:hypothetical protein [Chitinophagaceae bacterium]
MFLQWFDLFARIIKTIILSTVYTTLIFFILFLVYKKIKNKWLENRMKHKFKNWLLAHFLISLGLFAFSFSYWQDTGLGEAPQLPIGYGQIIYSTDFAWTEFYPDLEKNQLNKDELQIGNFKIKDNFLCAEVSHQNTDSPNFDFIVYDLTKKTFVTFTNETDYNEFAKKSNLPVKSDLYDFKTHFQEYFDNKPKWQKWLLP